MFAARMPEANCRSFSAPVLPRTYPNVKLSPANIQSSAVPGATPCNSTWRKDAERGISGTRSYRGGW